MKSLFLSLFLISFSFTQVFSSYDYVGSKATAMSGAVTSGSGGSWSMFHNPAQLADLSGIHFVNGYSRIYNLDFLPYYNMGISYNSYSVSFQKLSTEINDTELSSETTLSVSKGINIYKDNQSTLQSGIRFNLYQYELGQSSGMEGDGSSGSSLGSGSGFGIDIGFQGVLHNKYYIAYYLKNINSPSIGYGLGTDLPKSISIGLSYRPYEDLITSLDFNQLSGHTDSEIRFGIEYTIIENLILRAGTQTNPNRFSAGFLYNFLGADIAYSFITHHIMPTTHQLSIGFKFK
tara:strand:- start:712 stop:1581 length:870 start_codon:yes stop_codon:yes gene_type:complete